MVEREQRKFCRMKGKGRVRGKQCACARVLCFVRHRGGKNVLFGGGRIYHEGEFFYNSNICNISHRSRSLKRTGYIAAAVLEGAHVTATRSLCRARALCVGRVLSKYPSAAELSVLASKAIPTAPGSDLDQGCRELPIQMSGELSPDTAPRARASVEIASANKSTSTS